MAFYVVYIEEAHPSDAWQMAINVKEKVILARARSFDERAVAAGSCVQDLGIAFPGVIDDLDNSTEAAYTAWPDRIYLIDRQGRIAYKSPAGPFGFKPEELQSRLEVLSAGDLSNAHLNSGGIF